MSKADKLYLTDSECAARIGVSTEEFKSALVELDRQGFPMKDPLFANRRYWPSVRAWFDRRYGLGDKSAHSRSGAPDGKEKW